MRKTSLQIGASEELVYESRLISHIPRRRSQLKGINQSIIVYLL